MYRPNPRPRRSHRLALAALGLTVVLGACGGSAASGSSDGKTTKTTDAKGDSPSGAEGTGTPLEQLFSNTNASQGAIEDTIAACMRERGWQYTPNQSTMSQGISTGTLRDPKFVEQYGYGLSTQPPPEAFGVPSGADQPKDPNSTYLESLSDADKQRYDKDLFGAMNVTPTGANSDEGGAVAATPVEMDPNSCMAKAQADAAKTHPELSQEFGKRLGELTQGIESDPRMKDAMTKWSACMARSNFVYERPDQVFTELSERANKLFGAGGQGPVGTPSGGGLIVSTNGGGPAQGASPATTLSPSDQAALSKLQDEERATAKADMACQKDTIDKVRPELEQEVVDKLRSEFPGIGSGK